ncbi:hypothetical protein BH10BAC3_BH10BAC3_38770 [soil metagenome]
MIRKVVIPEHQNISIELPEHFLGKQVEIIAFTIPDTMDELVAGDKTRTHFASEKVLAKDWLTLEEDKAWQDL